MPQRSAGLLLYRRRDSGIEVFLVHPGGPFWAKKNLGAWSIPKGLYEPDEDPLAAAKREFEEETGFAAPSGNYIPIGELKQPGGKVVEAWAVEGDCDPGTLRSNLCTIEWPPRSRRKIQIPEIDRGQWFTLEEANRHILPGQRSFLDVLSHKAI